MHMSDQDIDKLVEQAEQNWQGITHGNPNGKKWGFFSYGDAPPAMGGGVGGFLWFDDRDAMLDFIMTTLPYSPPGQWGIDFLSVASETAAIVEDMKKEVLGDTVGIEQLNKVLRTFSQIEWMGTVDALLNGNHDYANRVRTAFREENDNTSSGSPVDAQERDEFFEYIEMWGI
jgi:hypothetical protein